MNSTAGGIGAVGAQDEPEAEATGVDLSNLRPTTPSGPVKWVEDDPARNRTAADIDAEAEAAQAMIAQAVSEGVHNALAEIAERIAALETSLAQLQGQHTQVEMALPQYGHALNTLDARLTAVAQQVARNFRLAALDAATRTAGPGLQTPDIIARAETFLRWIDPPPVEVQQPAPSLDDAEAVRH